MTSQTIYGQSCTNCNEGLQNTALPKPDQVWLLSQVRRATIDDQRAVLGWLKTKFSRASDCPRRLPRMTRKLVCEIKSPMLAFIQAAKHFRRYGGVDRSRRIPIGPHARLSRSPATALPIASGPSLYPLGTSKSIPPSRSTNLASIRLGLRFAIAGRA